MISPLFKSIVIGVLWGIASNPVTAQNTGEKQILWTADWSPDGKYIAIGGNTDSLQLYRAKNLRPYRAWPVKNTITAVKWHPSLPLIAVATHLSEDKVRIINYVTNDIMVLEGISPDGARGIDWNYTGTYLAVADNDGQVSIFDVHGQLIRQIQDNTKSLTSIDWHPSKNTFVTVGPHISMYDIEGHLLKKIQHRPEETLLLSVSWHRSGDFFVTGDYGDHELHYPPLLQFWGPNGDLIRSINTGKGEYRNMAWNAKGDRLATASDALRIWDKTGKLLYEGASNDYLWGIAWNPKGTRIVTSSIEQAITLWSSKGKKLIVR